MNPIRSACVFYIFAFIKSRKYENYIIVRR